jgi:hypothetical protein
VVVGRPTRWPRRDRRPAQNRDPALVAFADDPGFTRDHLRIAPPTKSATTPRHHRAVPSPTDYAMRTMFALSSP